MSEYGSNPNSQLGRRMLWVAAIGLLGGFYLLFSMLEEGGSGTVSSVDSSGATMVVLEQDRNGHYEAEGQINGRSVTFLVDTGATDVALPESTARALGLDFGPKVRVMTAAGPASAWVTRLDEVTVGGIRRKNVRATITDGEFNGILLGMSFLKHYNLQQQDGRLIIREAVANN
ncbi:MAG: TIGR02281 family clan AA aspartic protease [Xanthomonadales bacterium]|jgi:aspartyl protease family protein|nr:TIGR02281 family clan AA aspartic protease [Xanthomonadales bacterium]